MSDQPDDKKAAEAANAAKTAAAEQQAPAGDQLSQLMAGGAKATPTDLDQKALHAAEAALAEGQRALDQARAQLRGSAAPAGKAAAKGSRARELALRVLLGINLAAMATIALLPSKKRAPSGDGAPEQATTTPPAPAHDPVVTTPRLDDPVLRAFAAADRHDYRTAIRTLEQFLADSPRLDPGRRANILIALEHYATQIGDIPAAQAWQRQTEALRNSHSLPEDLVQMALEAEKNGDVESMRRHYARLLLQQRQIPSSLYSHVAEAYLKLGDSYRQEAEVADEAARQQQLQELREQLRLQAAQGNDGGEKHK